jgi:heat shock protein 4
VPAGSETAKLKVKVRMDLHGLVSVDGVQSIEEEEVVVEEGSEQPASASVSAGGAEGAATDAAAAPAADGTGGAGCSAEERTAGALLSMRLTHMSFVVGCVGCLQRTGSPGLVECVPCQPL